VEAMDCVFCEKIRGGDVLAQDATAVAFADAFPLTAGHTLIVSRRHEPDFLALSEDEHAAIWRLVGQVRAMVGQQHRPHGYNLGVNVGDVAGQTVGHAHLHVIPRYAGDVPEPRGGIRWIIPAKARYWTED
jgi:diadenosine tetraphosphate (Ap4A) HIT family hydrolase